MIVEMINKETGERKKFHLVSVFEYGCGEYYLEHFGRKESFFEEDGWELNGIYDHGLDSEITHYEEKEND